MISFNQYEIHIKIINPNVNNTFNAEEEGEACINNTTKLYLVLQWGRWALHLLLISVREHSGSMRRAFREWLYSVFYDDLQWVWHMPNIVP